MELIMAAHSNCLIFKRHLMTHLLLKTIEKINLGHIEGNILW